MNSYSTKYHAAFLKDSKNLHAGELFYPSGEVLKLVVLQHISEVDWSDCHYIQVSTRKCYCTVKGKRVYLIWGCVTTKAPMSFVYIFLYFKLFKDLQAALYSSVDFSYNLLLLCQWI